MTIPSPSPTPIVIELVNDGAETPEWLTTLLPFITLLIGAAITYFFTRLAQRNTERREDKLRWQPEIRALAAELIAKGQELNFTARQLAADIKGAVGLGYRPGDEEERIDDLRALNHEMYRVSSEILLLAPMEIADKAGEVVTRGAFLAVSVDEDYLENAKLLEIASHKFELAIRHYLGVDETLAVGSYSTDTGTRNDS